ncbi:hypothetical protein F2P56_001085 [Juglans regia]|uniref:Alpha/beta hydrolase fold-3 domain-containing protein n=2 Tax=Juglans regia TaxID=51240 RepID=A0A834D892_JUGRE|nr:carboxylesterase 1-like [Juglans regia]KAF5480325.1 hypothetical protein F2P56_001085 [Juglans regia]
MDPYKELQIVLNPDGTLTRLLHVPETPPTSDPTLHIPVLSKDIPINQSTDTWARVYLPREALHNSPSSTKQLPLVVFYHGGGFILFSASSTIFHDFCVNMATELRVIIVSVEYRLAPEHRLPAAYDDAVEALHWIRTTQEDWVRKYADFSNCFLMGGSAGANIAYNAGLRVAKEDDNLEPLKIRGLIMIQPFFGGDRRTGSELRLFNDPLFPPCMSDVMWELSLPVGVNRDHEYCNPTVGGGSKLLERIKVLGWKILVTGCDGDQLFDHQMEFVKLLETKDVGVVAHFGEGGFHGVDLRDPVKAKALLVICKDFVLSCLAV